MPSRPAPVCAMMKYLCPMPDLQTVNKLLI